jgi:carboxymethylenebutenolidase
MMPVPGAVTNPGSVTAERTTVAGDPALKAYLAQPATAGIYPGLVLIHEAFGLVPHIEDVARRFAQAGFVTLAPDLYSRTGAPDPRDRNDVYRKVLSLRDEDCVQDLERSAAHLRGLPQASGRVACLGFCSGGRNALLLACRAQAVDAAVDCWGGFITAASPDARTTTERPVPPADLISGLSCPLLAVFGAADTEPSPAHAGLLRERAAAANVPLRTEVFDGAGHAFFADYRPTYVADAAFRLWPLLLGFLRTHTS